MFSLRLCFHFTFQYFTKLEFIYATDPQKLCKTGDTVLIQSLPQKLTRLITHKVCILQKMYMSYFINILLQFLNIISVFNLYLIAGC